MVSLTHALSSYLSGGGLVGHRVARGDQTKQGWLLTLVCYIYLHTLRWMPRPSRDDGCIGQVLVQHLSKTAGQVGLDAHAHARTV